MATPYRIEIVWWILHAAGLVALALLIVCKQRFKVATSNPSESLRSE